MRDHKICSASERHIRIFQRIAPVYRLFFSLQTGIYRMALRELHDNLKISPGGSILDIGCGTGALAFCLGELGYKVTGVDAAPAMAFISRRLNKRDTASFIIADAAVLPFDDNIFDAVMASYVLHGLQKVKRIEVLSEASRLTKGPVIFYDYNAKRSIITDFIERLEGGDYFGFIAEGENEMRQVFRNVRVLPAGIRSAWYICEK